MSHGKSIRKHLKDCDKAVFMAVTISEGIDRLIRIAKVKDIAQAVVVDSMASAAVEQACDRAEQVIKKNIPICTRRSDSALDTVIFLYNCNQIFTCAQCPESDRP